MAKETKELVVGLDIGTSKVVALVAEVRPDGTAPDVFRRYESFARTLSVLGKRPKEIALSDRGAWRLKLDDGQLLELGRDQMDERLQRFVAAYPRTIAQLPAARLRIDLRYPNGFTVRGS